MHSLFQQASSLTEEVIAAAVRVQKHFGIGALESIYVRCLERELELAGHRTSREKGVSITYRGMTRTNRGARPSACGNATGGIDPDSRLHKGKPEIFPASRVGVLLYQKCRDCGRR